MPEEEPAPLLVHCRACGHDVIPGRFCASCGLTLPAYGRSDHRCTSCGSLVAVGASYCTDCGNPTGLAPTA